MSLAVERTELSSIENVASPAELTRIFDQHVQIVCWRRAADPGVAARISQELVERSIGAGFRSIFQVGAELAQNLRQAMHGQVDLARDVAFLADLYADLLGSRAVGVRLEVLRSTMCPAFHADRTGIRLLCTYCGPGTEWIDDCTIDRTKLGAGSAGLADRHSGLFGPTTVVQAAAPFEVLLLKGSLWQGNESRGAMHRSPAVSADHAARILLAIDAIWD